MKKTLTALFASSLVMAALPLGYAQETTDTDTATTATSSSSSVMSRNSGPCADKTGVDKVKCLRETRKQTVHSRAARILNRAQEKLGECEEKDGVKQARCTRKVITNTNRGLKVRVRLGQERRVNAREDCNAITDAAEKRECMKASRQATLESQKLRLKNAKDACSELSGRRMAECRVNSLRNSRSSRSSSAASAASSETSSEAEGSES